MDRDGLGEELDEGRAHLLHAFGRRKADQQVDQVVFRSYFSAYVEALQRISYVLAEETSDVCAGLNT